MWKLGVFPNVLFLGKSTFKQNLTPALGAVRVEFFSNQKTRTGGARGQRKKPAKQNPRGKGKDEVVVQGERDTKYDWWTALLATISGEPEELIVVFLIFRFAKTVCCIYILPANKVWKKKNIYPQMLINLMVGNIELTYTPVI